MVPLFPFLVFLHGLQRRAGFIRLICAAILAAFVIVYACNSNKAAVSYLETERSGGTDGAAETALPIVGDGSFRKRKPTTLSTINTPDYEVNLYWAIPFTPRGNGEGLIRADSGSQFVLLDLSVQNTTTGRTIDVGEILLKAKILGGDGREYASDPLIIAAFNLEYPYPNHKEHYRSFKGVLQPGKFCRAVVLGFEAPVDTKNFVLLLEGDNMQPENRFYKAAFSLK